MPAYRVGASANGNNASPTITVPSTVQTNDVIVIQLTQNNTDVLASAPSVLTLVDNNTAPSASFPARLYVGVANGSTLKAGTVLTWSLGTTTRAWSLVLYAASGVDPSTPVNTYLKSAANDANITTPTLSTNQSLWLVEVGAAKSNGTALTSWTAASGWTVRSQIGAYSTFAGSAFIADRNAGATTAATGGGAAGPATMGTAVASQSANNLTNTSIAVSLGTTTVGQLNVIELAGYSNGTSLNPTVTTPTGWTKLGEVLDTNSGGSVSNAQFAAVYYRVYQSGDGSTITFNWTNAGQMVALCTPWSGQHPTNPVPFGVVVDKTSTDASIAVASTVASASGLLCFGFANRSGFTFSGLTDNNRGTSLLSGGTQLTSRVTAAEVAVGTAFNKTATLSSTTSIGAAWAYIIQGGVGDGSQSYGGDTYAYVPTTTPPNTKITYILALNPSTGGAAQYSRNWSKNNTWVGMNRYQSSGSAWV